MIREFVYLPRFRAAWEKLGLDENDLCRMAVAPIPSYTADDIKHIRLSTGLTQRMFAEAMGVSQKAVEAWEAGKNAPAGPAVRMLGFLQSDPNLFDKTQIISR